jgi:hypothetical protein
MEHGLKGKLQHARRNWRSYLQDHRFWILLMSLTWGTYLTVLFSNILQLRPDGVYAGHPYVWADWSLHIGMSRVFAFQPPDLWFSYHPVYAGAPLNYPFMTNLITGMIMRLGGSLEFAFLGTSIFYCWALCFGLYFFFFLFLRSMAAAYAAVCLFFFSAGIGFYYFVNDLMTSGDYSQLLYPAKEYSRFIQYDWGSGNVLVGLLVPQRAFLLGLALGVWSLALYIYSMTEKFDKRFMILGGLCGGALAITHVHSLMALTIILGFMGLAFVKKWRQQLWFFLPCGALGLTLHTIFLKGAVNTKDFWVWFPGWTANSLFGWLVQWSWQWGFTLPIACIGLFFFFKERKVWQSVLGFSFFFLFMLSNLFRFQPINWDNSKVFLWAYLGFCGLCSYALTNAWGAKAWRKSIVVVCFLLLSLTGMLEILRLIQTDRNSWRMISKEDMAMSDEIRERTHPLSRFLTSPAHDHPIMMWATRPLIMGYSAWVFNYGFPYQQREADMAKMFQGDEDLLRKYEVSYVVLDQGSLKAFRVNETYFGQFPVAFNGPGRKIYDVRSVTGAQ